jgi:hypothetical protein
VSHVPYLGWSNRTLEDGGGADGSRVRRERRRSLILSKRHYRYLYDVHVTASVNESTYHESSTHFLIFCVRVLGIVRNPAEIINKIK